VPLRFGLARPNGRASSPTVGTTRRHGELTVTLAPRILHELTESQSRLVKRHERALLRLADELARRNGFDVWSIMFVIADTRGRIGGALRAAVPLPSIGPVVLPARAAQLEAWAAELGKHAPVWDLQGARDGISVIVIDEKDAIAVTRIDRQATR
jgi:hypothetical protein